jgi:hypothetical protein
MKLRSVIILLAAVVLQNCSKRQDKDDTGLSGAEKHNIIESTIRYSAKLAPYATHETKFFPEFDGYYKQAEQEYELLYYRKEPDSLDYFFMTRVARSITPMKEGIGGRLKFGKSGNLVAYEEIFRTWKMPLDTLKIRGKFLFDRMVNKEDLGPYYSKSQGDRYIEYPDERFYFDKLHRKWVDKILNSAQHPIR